MIKKEYAHLSIHILNDEFKYVLLKQQDFNSYLDLNHECPFIVVKSNEEVSAICSINIEFPDFIKEEKGWKAFKIFGEMPFGTVQGLISYISNSLFRKGIGICVVSSFITDYFFVRKENMDTIIHELSLEGWKIKLS